jgi:hypothetical protein
VEEAGDFLGGDGAVGVDEGQPLGIGVGLRPAGVDGTAFADVVWEFEKGLKAGVVWAERVDDCASGAGFSWA